MCWFHGNTACLVALLGVGLSVSSVDAQKRQPRKRPRTGVAVTFPPKLPGDHKVVTDRSEEFLKAPATLVAGVKVAKTPPTVDFLYYPGQTYEGKPWSNWGDSLAVAGKYYASIGDHLAIGSKGDGTHGTGTGFVYEYDPDKKTFRQLVNTSKVLNLPKGHYTPGKIHGRLDMGSDGWLYFSTHRGSPRASNDRYHYQGDWILRTHPPSGKTEVVVQAPVPKHAIPCSVLDPERLIFYGGTAPGSDAPSQDIHFFAYDVRNRKLLYDGPDGPSRYMILAKSTGRVYFNPGKSDTSLMRYDPDKPGGPVKIPGTIGIRSATRETPQGYVYTVSKGGRGTPAILYAFNTKTEEVEELGPAAVGTQGYIASLDADPTGRYLYYNAGAHGGAAADGCAVVQYDTKTKQKKVIAFLHPFYEKKYGCTLKGTYSSAVDPAGDKLYITWNASRGSRAWDCCALTVLHLPESER
jgi:hypothetical protein